MRALFALSDRWIARAAAPDPGARAAVANLRPAVAVTGGSAGIGLAIARSFAAGGEAVLLVGRDPVRLEAACASMPGGAAAAVLALDITAPEAPERIEAALAAQGWYLDTLVNCAGVGLAGAFDSHTPDEIDRLVALNVAALTRLTRHALASMRARARGGILNVASLGGYVPGPGQAAYYASKAYVCSLTEAIASELAGAGVRVCVLAPGPVETGFHAAMGADAALYRWLIPAMSPERTAKAAVFGYRLGRTVVVPGAIATVLAVLATVTPHWLSAPILRAVLMPRP